MTRDAAATPAHELPPVEISVLRGEPTEDELAALIAVVTEAYDAEVESAVVEDSRPASAWARGQRALRQPFSHGPGAWERFGR